MSVAWKVKFCEDCSRAFDVPVRRHGGTPAYCPECKLEHKKANQRRWLESRRLSHVSETA